jgi:hypothetical protein
MIGQLVIPYSAVVAIGLIVGCGAIVQRSWDAHRSPASAFTRGTPFQCWFRLVSSRINTSAVVRDAAGGQYEGESYLGAGALFLLVVALWLERARLVVAMIETERIRQWLLEHNKLWQFPSWDCGGLVSTRAFKNLGWNQELQLELLAVQLGKPSNSVLMGRF